MSRIKPTPGPWHVRYCDDASHMCMTVISTKDHGDSNRGLFDNEQDTVAIVYHQLPPLVDPDPDIADANARLIAAAPRMFEVIESLEYSIEDTNIAFAIQDILKSVRGYVDNDLPD